ncbi:alcohol dehydrogenase [Flagelloscypha sp. PMI_526]|nr:alcohol dehydrogenase [Flagelloscypha sp. PMI_526]
MSSTVNGKVIFNSIPQGYPEPGKTTIYDDRETIDLDNVSLDGGILIKTLAVSVDPYFRGRMREPHIPSYLPAFPLGQPISSYGVGTIVRSEMDGFTAGDHILGVLPLQHYSILKEGITKINNEHNLPWTWFLGILGGPGKTAYHAWKEFSRAKAGETVYVTSAAGAVGAIVVQLAKAQGLKVIGSAGSEEKVIFLKEIGAEVAFNYKTENTLEVLQREGGIDVFWDNVGGSQLEASLEAAHIGARFIECGMMEEYNTTPYHVKNLMQIVSKGITLYGFIIFRDLTHKWDAEFWRVMPDKVAKGEIKTKEDITSGLEKVGDVILAVQKGLNVGKAVVVVAEE